jgi:hypothetical protein
MKAQSARPSKELLVRVRAALVLKGTSFNAWCRANSIVRRTAEQALTGQTQSANAQTIINRILRDASLSDAA